MKKSVLVIALAFGVTGAFAQDLTSKKGEPILPEAEDWAISMNADPIFRFVGNAFNGNTDNAAPGTNWMNGNQTIIGKKFIDEKSAYRVVVRLGFTSQTFKNMVADDAFTGTVTFPDAAPMVEDKFKMKNTNIGIGVGKEMRRGKTRLQGYYGADAMIWLSASSNKFEYGNTMSATTASGTTMTPTSTTWNTSTGAVTGASASGARTTVTKSGMTFGIGVRGFIGAEYFIFPKISIGAEYGWGIGFQTTGKGKSTVESTGGTPATVGETETITSGTSKFGFDTDLNQGTIFGFKGSNTGSTALRVTFHF
ncbi:MAG TPA: hypothetical protein VGC65_08100 [Bacteroidia bacterium]|jgi:hypothetical protein